MVLDEPAGVFAPWEALEDIGLAVIDFYTLNQALLDTFTKTVRSCVRPPAPRVRT